MAPPWVKGPTQSAPVVVSNPPWMKGPAPPSPAVPSAPPPAQYTAPAYPAPQQVPRPSFTAANHPTAEPSNSPFAPRNNPRPQMAPQAAPTMQNSGGPPKSLGALLQQAPLRAPSPAVNEGAEYTAPSSNQNIAKTPLKTLRMPVPAGPLAGAKLVLPPLPPSAPLKKVSGKTTDQIAKINRLRSSVRPRPKDLRSLLSEIENGLKLNHVTCNDRSKPLVGRCNTFYPDF